MAYLEAEAEEILLADQRRGDATKRWEKSAGCGVLFFEPICSVV